MASPLQPFENVETNNDDLPGADADAGPVQPGDLIDFTV